MPLTQKKRFLRKIWANRGRRPPQRPSLWIRHWVRSPGTVYHWTGTYIINFQKHAQDIFSHVATSLTVSKSTSSEHCMAGALVVTLAMLLRLINCRFIIIYYYYMRRCRKVMFLSTRKLTNPYATAWRSASNLNALTGSIPIRRLKYTELESNRITASGVHFVSALMVQSAAGASVDLFNVSTSWSESGICDMKAGTCFMTHCDVWTSGRTG